MELLLYINRYLSFLMNSVSLLVCGWTYFVQKSHWK